MAIDGTAELFVSWNTKALKAAIEKEMVDVLVPAVRAALEASAATLAAQFEGTPLACYFAEELLIKELADFITLSNTEEMELVRPALLANAYVKEWFSDGGS